MAIQLLSFEDIGNNINREVSFVNEILASDAFSVIGDVKNVLNDFNASISFVFNLIEKTEDIIGSFTNIFGAITTIGELTTTAFNVFDTVAEFRNSITEGFEFGATVAQVEAAINKLKVDLPARALLEVDRAREQIVQNDLKSIAASAVSKLDGSERRIFSAIGKYKNRVDAIFQNVNDISPTKTMKYKLMLQKEIDDLKFLATPENISKAKTQMIEDLRISELNNPEVLNTDSVNDLVKLAKTKIDATIKKFDERIAVREAKIQKKVELVESKLADIRVNSEATTLQVAGANRPIASKASLRSECETLLTPGKSPAVFVPRNNIDVTAKNPNATTGVVTIPYEGGRKYLPEEFKAVGATRFANNIAAKINECHPSARARFASGMKKLYEKFGEAGYEFNISFAYRSPELQNSLYIKAQAGGPRAAAPWRSLHNYGLAIDITIYVNGKYDNGARSTSNYTNVARSVMEEFGITNQLRNDSGHFYPQEFTGSKVPREMFKNPDRVVEFVAAPSNSVAV